MNASIPGLYRYLIEHKHQSGCIEYNGNMLTREETLLIIDFGLNESRETLNDITDEEVEQILKKSHDRT